jgi:hypothetical protein
MTKSNKKIFLFFITVGAILIWPEARGWNDRSRMATIQSIVEYNSLAIDNSIFIETGDKVYINGHFYSDKPVMPALLGAVIYFPLFKLGILLNFDWNLAYYLITLLTVKLFWFFGIISFLLLLNFTSIDEKWKYLLTMIMGFGTIYFTWSSTFNNHILAASFLIIGIYYIFKFDKDVEKTKYLFLGGLFISLAGVSDIPTAVFYVGYLIYVCLKYKSYKKYVFYLLPVLFTALPTLFINYYISGDLIPIQIIKSNFVYEGSPWVESGNLNNISGIGMNSGIFIFLNAIKLLIGYKGFLLYNPLLIIAIFYLAQRVTKKGEYFFHALIIGIASASLILYYVLFTKNCSGWSYSIRWFVPLIPILHFFIYPYFYNLDFKKNVTFYILAIVSILIALIGLINPWSIMTYSKIPIIANIMELVHFLSNS